MNDSTRRIILVISLAIIVLAIYWLSHPTDSSTSLDQSSLNSHTGNANAVAGATSIPSQGQNSTFQNDSTTPLFSPKTTYISDPARIASKALQYTRAPELNGITGAINTYGAPITLEGLRGKVVLLDFMTYSCINCIRTFPALSAWYSTYKDQGLVVIGVHTPEFQFEKEYDNVAAAVQQYHLLFPIVLDNNMAVWNAYHNRYWPHQFLIDEDGFIRYDHIGEGGDTDTDVMIRKLLEEAGSAPNNQTATIITNAPSPDETNVMLMSPETYTGSDRNPGIGSAKSNCASNTCTYEDASSHQRDVIYLNGTWDQENEYLQYAGSEVGYLSLAYQADAINAVLSTDQGTFETEVLLDGKPLTSSVAGKDIIFHDGLSYVNATMSRLYELTNHDFAAHEITLITKNPNFRINSFTFG